MIFGTEKNPKGPKWSRARRVVKDIGLANIIFMAPPNTAPFSDQKWERQPDHIDITDDSVFENNEIEKYGLSTALTCYANSWEFRGLPVLQGYCGHVNMFLRVLRRSDIPVNQTLLNPDDFTETALNYIASSFLGKNHDARRDDPYDLTEVKWPDYLAPLNYHWFKNSSSENWCYFENQSLVDGPISAILFTPLSDDTFISLTFVIFQSAMNAGNAFRVEKRVPRSNFMKLVNNIIDSIKIEFKDDALSEEQIQARDAFNSMDVLPVIRPTESYIELSKTVMQAWSSRGYRGKSKSEDSHAHRAAPEEVSQFIDSLMETRFRDNALKIGDIIYRDFVDQSANEKEIAATKSLENT